MDLSIIIVNYNVYEDILICIESIYTHFKDSKFEIIVIDNNSSDRSIEKLNLVFKDVKLIKLDSNRGFGAANNEAMKIASGKYFFLVNPDIIFQDGTSLEMIKFLEENNKIGTIGPIQLKPGSGVEYYYSFFPSLYSRFAQEFGFYMTAPVMRQRFFEFWDKGIEKNIPFKVDWVMGSTLMLRREIYDKLRGFNEAFFLYEEETEWQYRMNKAGWESWIYPNSKVIHNHHSSSGKLGQLFVHYHEFRSRIIFSNLHDMFFKRVMRTITVSFALILRISVNFVKYLFSRNQNYMNKIRVFIKLFSFNSSSKSAILNSRFTMSEYQSLISQKDKPDVSAK